MSPEFWQFGVGFLLVVAVLLNRLGVYAKLGDFGRSLLRSGIER